MNDADRKLLTEYLGECWQRVCPACYANQQSKYPKIGKLDECTCSNRTFTTSDDMMDLYQAIWRTSWMDFVAFMYPKYGEACGFCGYVAWLFCLSGEGYEAACQRVADWIKEGI